mgnify:CR=1 FL=1
MKINIISRNDSKGGAAIAAFRLHKSLESYRNQLKISSSMRVAYKCSNNKNVKKGNFRFSYERVFLNNKIERLFQKLQKSDYLDSQQLAKIKSLRKQGEAALRLGEVEKSEEILNMALALFK